MERCDGIDNDCNGVVDDGPDTVCVVGACRESVPFCTPCASLRARLERCDGIDNDCDGMVDGPAADASCRTAGDPHRADVCRDGRCVVAPAGVCDRNWAQCPSSATCGTDLMSSPEHCGRCGQRCAAGVCADGRCPLPTRVDLTNSGALAAISTTGGPLYVCGVGMVGFIATASYPYACTPVSELSDSLAFLRVGGLRCAVRRSGRVTCRVLEGLRDAAFVDAYGVYDAVDAVERQDAGIILRASGEIVSLAYRPVPGSILGTIQTTSIAVFPSAERLFPSDRNHICFGVRGGAVECHRSASGVTPQRVELPPETIAVSYDAGSYSCAVLRSGRVTCWGNLMIYPRVGGPQTPPPGVDMGLSGIRQITTNPYGGCATQGPVGGTWCWGNVAALIGRQQGDTPRPMGFPPTRIEGFDDMEAVTLDMPYELRPPFLAGITVRRTVICRGHNYSFVCGAVSSDGLARTLIWGVE